MMSILQGKVAVVTGATKAKGLGRAIAEKLASQGAKVVLTGRPSSQAGMQANVDAIKASGGEAMGVLVDVSDTDQINAAISEVAEAYGSIDILVNNAGVGFGSAIFDDNSEKDWEANYNVNVMGTLAMCRAVAPYMEKAGGGSIVNVASTAGIAASAGMPYPYVATKHGLVGVTKVMALEVAEIGIRCNVVAPGAIHTDMLQAAYEAIASAGGISVEEAAAAENASIPMGRPAQPAEIAAAIAFLAGPDASYITGIVLPVAGGMAPGI
jgi:NAD(P)-dependent dehydrogenase (short-subunit alcohol dehydrogenase family)